MSVDEPTTAAGPDPICECGQGCVMPHQHRHVEAPQQDASALRLSDEAMQAIVDAAFPTGGTEGPNAWTEERIRVRTRFAESLDRILAALPPSASAGLDVERLAKALYEQTRRTYRDQRRAPPPWDVITTRSRNTEWKPQGGSRAEHYGSLADSYRSQASALAAEYARLEQDHP